MKEGNYNSALCNADIMQRLIQMSNELFVRVCGLSLIVGVCIVTEHKREVRGHRFEPFTRKPWQRSQCSSCQVMTFTDWCVSLCRGGGWCLYTNHSSTESDICLFKYQNITVNKAAYASH